MLLVSGGPEYKPGLAVKSRFSSFGKPPEMHAQGLVTRIGWMRSDLPKKDLAPHDKAIRSPENVFGKAEHSYSHVGDAVFFQLMNFEADRPHHFTIARRELVCIQIMFRETSDRLAEGRTSLASPAQIQVTNPPKPVAEIEAGENALGLFVACERRCLLDEFGLNVESVPPAYRPIFTRDAGMAEALQLPISPSTISIAEQLIACKLPEPLRSLYVKAKSIELICNVVAQINVLPQQRAARIQPAPIKAQAIESAASIYRRETSRPPTIKKLAARVGLNRNDLSKGFRDMFGTTPHQFALRVRMEQAQSLLREGRLSISEIARRIGYEGYSSFSKAYRAHFGHGPHVPDEHPAYGGQRPGKRLASASFASSQRHGADLRHAQDGGPDDRLGGIDVSITASRNPATPSQRET